PATTAARPVRSRRWTGSRWPGPPSASSQRDRISANSDLSSDVGDLEHVCRAQSSPRRLDARWVERRVQRPLGLDAGSRVRQSPDAGTAAYLAIAVAVLAAPPAAGARGVVRDGNARFEVLSATLIRLEYAADGRFEDRPTIIAIHRRRRARFRTRIAHGVRVIRTRRLTLRYRRGSGRFGPGNLEILLRVGRRLVAVHPRFPGPPGRQPPPPMPPARTQAPSNPDPHPGPRTKGNL